MTDRAKEKIKQADKPILGIAFYVIYCFLKTLGYVVAQMLYDRHTEMKPFQLLFIRSVFGILIMIAMLHIKMVMIMVFAQ